MRCRTLFWCGLAALWFTHASSTAAAAPTDRIHLSYTAPEGCPGRDDVLRAIDALLDPGARLDPTLQVEARVDARDADYALSLSWMSASGTGHRNIEAESCEAAADAAAWLIALAIKQPAQPQPASESEAPDSGVLGYEFGVGGVSSFGVLPGAAFGAGLRAGLAWHKFHADLALAYFPAKQISGGGATVELDLAEVSIDACYLFEVPSFAAGPCASASIGHMGATSQGLSAPTSGGARFQAFTVSVQLRARLTGPLWLTGDAGLAWHQRRPLFVLSGGETLHQPASAGLSLGIGLLLVLN